MMAKPPAIEPAEAIAIALSIVRWTPGKMQSPDGIAVRLILKSLKDCGWKFEPMEITKGENDARDCGCHALPDCRAVGVY